MKVFEENIFYRAEDAKKLYLNFNNFQNLNFSSVSTTAVIWGNQEIKKYFLLKIIMQENIFSLSLHFLFIHHARVSEEKGKWASAT